MGFRRFARWSLKKRNRRFGDRAINSFKRYVLRRARSALPLRRTAKLVRPRSSVLRLMDMSSPNRTNKRVRAPTPSPSSANKRSVTYMPRGSSYRSAGASAAAVNAPDGSTFNVTRWMKYKPSSPLSIDWKGLKDLPMYERQWLQSFELRSSTGKQKSVFVPHMYAYRFQNLLRHNEHLFDLPVDPEAAGVWALASKADQTRIAIQQHYTQWTLSNQSTTPIRVRMIRFVCTDTSTSVPGSLWDNDLANKNAYRDSEARIIADVTAPTNAQLTTILTRDTLGEFPHTHGEMRNRWKISGHLTMTLPPTATTHLTTKGPTGTRYIGDYYRYVVPTINGEGNPLYNQAMMLKGLTTVTCFIVQGIALASTSSGASTGSNTEDVSLGQLTVKHIDTVKFKFPDLVDRAPRKTITRYMYMGATEAIADANSKVVVDEMQNNFAVSTA